MIARLFIGDGPFVFLINPSFTLLPQYMLFLANFNLAFGGGSSVPTDVLWSISVEEQFYLVWPWLIALLPRKHILKTLGLIVLIACVYRYFYALSPNVIAYSTFSVMSDLAIGSILAFLVYTRSSIVEKLRSTPRKIIIGVYAFLLLIVSGRHYITEILVGSNIIYNLFVAIFPLILATTYAFIILEQNEMPRSLFKIGKSKSLGFLGKISYGLYSYHIFAFAIVILGAIALGFNPNYTSTIQWIIISSLSLITVLILSIISYYGMEKPFLKRKPKSD
jgi:peptidoglycan/LPS O-acetylase OafA/YrhL